MNAAFILLSASCIWFVGDVAIDLWLRGRR